MTETAMHSTYSRGLSIMLSFTLLFPRRRLALVLLHHPHLKKTEKCGAAESDVVYQKDV